MGPGKQPVQCATCGKTTYQSRGELVCPGCGWTRPAEPEVVVLPTSEAEAARAIADALAASGFLAQHAGEVVLLQKDGLVPIAGPVTDRCRTLISVASKRFDQRGAEHIGNPRPLKRDEAVLAIETLKRSPDRLPRCDLVAPRSVLVRTADGDVVATRRGLDASGVATIQEVEPTQTGEWLRLLDSVLFATDEDRLTFEAVAMSLVLPLEAGLYPLVVVSANAQAAGKTWLARMLGWTLGYPGATALKVNPENELALRRAIVGALRDSRVLLVDNVSGSGVAHYDSAELAEVVTEDVVTCGKLYDIGTLRRQNRGTIFLTLNRGTIGADLATRAVSVRLEMNPDDPRLARRNALGELYWADPEVSRKVLAELLWVTRERWRAGSPPPPEVAGTLPRPQTWRRLVWRLLGKAVGRVDDALQGITPALVAWLRAQTTAPISTTALAEAARQGPVLLRDWAEGGAAAFGAHLSRIAGAGALRGLQRRHTKTGTVWEWRE